MKSVSIAPHQLQEMTSVNYHRLQIFKEDASYADSLVEETRRRGRPLKLDKPLRTRMGFRISDEMLQEVEALCEQTGLSKTDLILQAIQSYIDSNRPLTGTEQHS